MKSFILLIIYASIASTLSGCTIEAQKINNCYTSGDGNPFYGAAIFARNSLPSLNDALIEVKNTDPAASTLAIQNCDKAIVTLSTALNAKNLYIDNCLMGVMNYLTTNKLYNIEDNILQEPFIGMQFLGDNGNSVVKNNTINISTYGVTTGLYSMVWPFGIDVKNYINTNPNSFIIDNNVITLDGYSCIGLNLSNTSNQVNAYKNTINLTNNNGTIFCMDASNLCGISASNVLGTKMEGNHVDGNPALLLQAREDMTGILINNSQLHELHCNHITNTRFGITAQSECLTTEEAVKGNTMFNHVLGMAFRHLGTEGTFGDIGTLNDDNNNSFLGSGYTSKVFKFCENLLGDKIYTNPSTLDQPESESVDINDATVINTCRYDVLPNSGAVTTYNCPSILNILPPNANDDDYFELAEALAIATDTKQYAEYYEISRWMDMRKLFKQLENDSTFRNSHATLLAFYNTMLNDAIQEVNEADDKLRQLIETYQSNNAFLIEQGIIIAANSNDNIPNDDVQNENEQLINAIYLRVLRYGIDSINNDDSSNIINLAVQCPYMGGTAVYKARTLHSMFAPTVLFDDMKLCNAIGVYRVADPSNNNSSVGIFDEENKYLQSLKPDLENQPFTLNQFAVYPNPTNSEIHIRYKESRDTKLQIINMLGVVIKEINLSKNVQHVLTTVGDLAQGIYIYQQIDDREILNTGKLVITD